MKSLFHKINRISTPLSLLFIYLLIGPGLLPGVVLCVGADGHVSVEAAYGGRCGAPSDVTSQKGSHSPTMFEPPKTFDHCGPCLDLPILTHGSAQQYLVPAYTPEQQFRAPFIPTFSLSQPACAAVTIENLIPNFPPRINPTLISLRTVTLLI